MPKPTIGVQISWIARMLRTRFDARARSLGLTRSQWQMIATISFCEGATQSELASQIEINTVTAGRIIDRLEAAGLIERRSDPIDRRLKRLHMKPAAGPLLEKLSVLGADEERVALAGFSTDEKGVLNRLLGRMADNMVQASRLDPVARTEPFGDHADMDQVGA